MKKPCTVAKCSRTVRSRHYSADYPGLFIANLRVQAKDYVILDEGSPPPPKWNGVYVRVNRYADGPKTIPHTYVDELFLFTDDESAKKKTDDAWMGAS